MALIVDEQQECMLIGNSTLMISIDQQITSNGVHAS